MNVREIHQLPSGDGAPNPGLCPDQELNLDPSPWDDAPSTEPHPTSCCTKAPAWGLGLRCGLKMPRHNFVSSLSHLNKLKFNLTNSLQYLIVQFMCSLLEIEKDSWKAKGCGARLSPPAGSQAGRPPAPACPRERAGQRVVRLRSGLGGSSVSAETEPLSHFLSPLSHSYWRLPDRKVLESHPKRDTEAGA